jgi:predicted DNA-binding ribbon-helix-helix protein
MSKELTLEKLAVAIIQLKKENQNLAEELRVVKEYLRQQHKLKKQMK